MNWNSFQLPSIKNRFPEPIDFWGFNRIKKKIPALTILELDIVIKVLENIEDYDEEHKCINRRNFKRKEWEFIDDFLDPRVYSPPAETKILLYPKHIKILNKAKVIRTKKIFKKLENKE